MAAVRPVFLRARGTMGSLVGQAALWSAAVFTGGRGLGEASRAPNDRLSPPVARGEPVARVLRTDRADARYPAGRKRKPQCQANARSHRERPEADADRRSLRHC